MEIVEACRGRLEDRVRRALSRSPACVLGEGGTHAWVEVLVPHPQDREALRAVPFDPTHERRPGLRYVTVAVGRDYGDVPPTSGTFDAPYPGGLTTHKRAAVTRVEYMRPPRRRPQPRPVPTV